MTSLKDFYGVLEQVMSRKESILIVATDYDSEVIDTLVLNKIKAGFKICAVKAPRLNKTELLEDISVITNAFCLNDLMGGVGMNHLGGSEKIIVDKHTTTIINGNGTNLSKHIEYLLQHGQEERAAKLQGGIATLYVGANSEVELVEKKDRIEDALCATKAAIAEGIVPGGGSVYVRAAKNLENLGSTVPDIQTGINIIKNALLYPIKQICSNAGISGDVVAKEILNPFATTNYGYNAKDEFYGDMIELGIIDPAKAVRVALENAASVAGLFLTTECVIVDDID